MWTCSECSRIFKSVNQPHSCKRVPIEKHFEGKEKAKELFDVLYEKVNKNIGKCSIISLPCCIHLFGKYDFLAALPKKNRLQIRFAMDRKLKDLKLKDCVPLSLRTFKNCFDISSKSEIDKKFLGWLKESYHLKD